MNILKLVLITLFVISPAVAQDLPIEKGWKGIEVFKTKRSEVEKILGNQNSSEDRVFTIYTVPEGKVVVTYSGCPCVKNVAGKSDYNVDENTVIEYEVNLIKSFPLSELKWSRERYEYAKAPHRPGVANYADLENGIVITVSLDSDVETVTSLSFTGSKQMRKTLSCPSLSAKAAHTIFSICAS